eukprot:TRINITY_DN1568_c0_g1_i1.p1 TRINITY_DN1568_c0_g1~~TRINITY_DN1568_c0_g1_i1.p1  ORF type:complete len:366 (+),score=71.82 TRINITY_DN1568_c0_g1_i1:34-1098(+)
MGTPPDPAKLIETFVVNLDLPPEQRWTAIIKEKKPQIMLLLAALKEMFYKHDVTDELIAAINSSMPNEYVREMQGMGDAIGVDYKDVVMANLFYEISGVTDALDLSRSCTSIVAQRANGTVYLARNQDYPPPFTLVMIHAIFTKNNKMIYEGTTYAGTIGLSTGAVPDAWSVAINARSNAACHHGKAACQKAAVDAAASGAQIFPIFTRQAIDTVGSDFDAAMEFFSTRELIMPGYIIVGGVNPGEGAIITRNATANMTDVFHLFDKKAPDGAGGDWYVVQTNTDHWVPTSNSSRRTTATNKLDTVGNKLIDLSQLWDVLSTPPVYNEATIHTDLISEKWDEYRTYKRHGPLTN